MRWNRQSIYSAFILAVFLLLPGSAWAQTGNGTATAEILQTIQVAAVADLDFGQIVPRQVAGSVTVSSSGAVTSSDVFVITQGAPGQWSVTGLAGESYQITLPSSARLRLNGNSSSVFMDATSFEHNAGVNPTLDGSGGDVFNVGATLGVGGNQVAGSYSGIYAISVAYN